MISPTTKTLRVDPQAPDQATIDQAAAVIRQAGLVAFPTETVYGLGANALDSAAVAKIFAAKGRPASDPLIVHIATIGQLDLVASDISPLARALASAFWPGPLTLVVKRRPAVAANVSAGRDSVAVRMPAHPVARALCAAAGLPIAAPSANLFTRTSPTTAAHVLEDLDGRIDMLLDGGATPIGLESTVLDLTGALPLVLRPGGLALEELRRLIPDLVYTPSYIGEHTAAQASPGMLLKHYSPRAELLLFTGAPDRAQARMHALAEHRRAAGQRVGVMAPDEEARGWQGQVEGLIALGPRADLAKVGQRIFAGLRELDRRGIDVILVRGLDRSGIGLAIWDRLLRAASGRVLDADDDER